MAKQPKWTTPTRQTHLVTLFLRSKGFCVFGHPKCTIPEHHYEIFIDNLVADWIADDRAQRQADWQAETKARHSTNERTYPLHGRFSGIGQDIYYDNQPEFYLEGLGISGLTFKPFAKLRLASSYIRLHVDLDDILKPVSKSQKRKAIRYGKIPTDLQDKINDRCWQAVKHYANQ
jgi:hypothetical protein